MDITLKCGKSSTFYVSAYMYYPLWAVSITLSKSINWIQNRLGKKCVQRCQCNRMRKCNNVLSINMSEKILFMHSARQINSSTSTSKKDNLIKMQCERKLIFDQGGKEQMKHLLGYIHTIVSNTDWSNEILNIHVFKRQKTLNSVRFVFLLHSLTRYNVC